MGLSRNFPVAAPAAILAARGLFLIALKQNLAFPPRSLATRKSIGMKAMVEMSDGTVERMAKKLAEKDGFEWQMDFKPPLQNREFAAAVEADR